ncbi:ArpU family phage packaging/lysis transcriptional regulator [Limosilactobacillus sp.]|uniref:ArpU family phage packaging/lysis transcriptional regulator n=1 Tax=Limosilactobacillus sp. TaxID=2773925 RepID=UPI00345E0FCD
MLFDFVKQDDIDQKATAQNVRNFFYRDVENIMEFTGFDVQSVRFDSQPSGSNLNGVESQMVHGMDILKELRAVLDTIYSLDTKSRDIMIMRFLQHRQTKMIAIRLGYSYSRYKDLQRKALVKFAINYYLKTNRQLVIYK